MCCKKRSNFPDSGAGRRSCGRRAGGYQSRCGRTIRNSNQAVVPVPESYRTFDTEKQHSGDFATPYLAQATNSTTLPLAIPSLAVHLTSGFPYTPALAQLGISELAWRAFNDELTAEAKLSFGQAAALVGSAGTLCAVGLWFHGIYLGSQMRHRSTIKKVNESYATGRDGVAAVVKRWNKAVFAERGLEVRLLLPEGNVPLVPYSASGRAWRRMGGHCASRYAIMIAKTGSLEEGGEERIVEVEGDQRKGVVHADVEEPPEYEDEFYVAAEKV